MRRFDGWRAYERPSERELGHNNLKRNTYVVAEAKATRERAAMRVAYMMMVGGWVGLLLDSDLSGSRVRSVV